MEYTLRSGKVVTDEQIEAMAEAIEAGSLPGQWSGEVVVGRPRLADEPLDVISFKVPHSLPSPSSVRPSRRASRARPSCARPALDRARKRPGRQLELGGARRRRRPDCRDCRRPVLLGTNDASPICEARSN